ncbi:MAG TPA: beta-ketoacyl-ACP synthase III [Acidimicrobiales bacterium]|nr:beta-ketoacyl-ACP synthase III [Acidimicrobiales bacterium]
MRGAAVSSWGAALPENVVTNADLEAKLDTNDAWIVERTGIRERRVGGTTAALATEAASRALDRAGLGPRDIDLLVLATTTPDQEVPATSADVADRLGLRGGAMDVNAACSGFVYALVAAAGMVGGGLDRVLVVGAETLSRITDQHDRTTAVLFADAAGAVVVEAVPGESKLLGYDLGADGSLRSLLYCDRGGFIVMEGQEVFRRAVRATVDSARAALERAKVSAEDIALFVPHQANLRIIDAAGQRLGLPRERTAVVLDRTGNTSAASVPLALSDAADAGRVAPGDLVLLSGFGAGMTWASAVLRWGR